MGKHIRRGELYYAYPEPRSSQTVIAAMREIEQAICVSLKR